MTHGGVGSGPVELVGRATPSGASRSGAFADFVRAARAAGRLVVQPRMGMHDPLHMRAGLAATRSARATTVGTVTVDSFTRTGDLGAVHRAIRDGIDLNGYPLVSHGPQRTAQMLDGICGADFPVQVRHGSAAPLDIVRTLLLAGIDATEGGPVSYCLPYGQTPLAVSVDNWARSVELLAELRTAGIEPHLETFGGCLLGQLCPPSLLVAMSVLEGLFFRQRGVGSISLSYAQQTHPGQDEEAVLALHRLAAEHLPDVDRHVVLYAYMGVYPSTEHGAMELLAEAAELAVRTGAARLIVKTAAEAHRIPTVAQNVRALEFAADVARTARPGAVGAVQDSGIHREASDLVQAVLELHADVGAALRMAFRRGHLDLPYCLHPDNAGRARARLTDDGRLAWAAVGSMPIEPVRPEVHAVQLSSAELISALSYVARRFDGELPAPRRGTLCGAGGGRVR